MCDGTSPPPTMYSVDKPQNDYTSDVPVYTVCDDKHCSRQDLTTRWIEGSLSQVFCTGVHTLANRRVLQRGVVLVPGRD